MRLLLPTFVITVLLSTSAQAMTKQEYKDSLRKKSPTLLCDMTLFGTCFVEQDEVCVAKAREEIGACIQANEKLIPTKFTVSTLFPITQKIHACMGNHLRRKLHLKKNASAQCRKFQQTVVK